MNNRNHRPLLDTKNVSIFMKNILDVDPIKNKRDANLCIKIRDTEQLLKIYYGSSTDKTPDCRHPRYIDNDSREKLQQKIIVELFTKKRLRKDDDVRLGKDGLLPSGIPRNENKFFLITGLPASGKSEIANKIADQTGAIIVDSDIAKRKFPEFKANYGAALVHDEAALITNGQLEDPRYVGLNILSLAITQNMNIVMPKTCYSKNKTEQILNYISETGYECYIVHIELDREKATRRAFDRFKNTGRYVPLALIYDGYTNDPTLTYHAVKNLKPIRGHMHISTDVERGHPPILIENNGCNDCVTWIM